MTWLGHWDLVEGELSHFQAKTSETLPVCVDAHGFLPLAMNRALISSSAKRKGEHRTQIFF